MEDHERYKNEIIDLVHEGRDYSSIRAFLVRKGLADEDIQSLMKIVDNEQLQLANNKEFKLNRLNSFAMGFIFLTLGIGITAYTYLSGGSSFILAYGAIISGAALIVKGVINKNQLVKSDPLIKRKLK